MPKLNTTTHRTVTTPETDTRTEAIKQYEEWGFTVRNRPDGLPPDMPTVLSTLNLDELGDLQARYAAWREYLEDLKLVALSEYGVLKSNYDKRHMMAKAELLEDSRYAKFGVEKLESLVIADEQLQPLAEALIKKDAMCEVLTNKFNSYVNVLVVLSREITRRSNVPA